MTSIFSRRFLRDLDRANRDLATAIESMRTGTTPDRILIDAALELAAVWISRDRNDAMLAGLVAKNPGAVETLLEDLATLEG